MGKEINSNKNRVFYHWSDVAAANVVRQKGDKDRYTLAAGITPSGVVHIGNFREIITVDLVKRALEKLGKKVRFIYSWDDYDVFRKVPKDMPHQDRLHKEVRKPIVDVFDPTEKEESYARANEVSVENTVLRVDIKPEFLYQSNEYRKSRYAKEIQHALKKTSKIKEILNQYRKEPLGDNWLPVSVFSHKFGTDRVEDIKWDGDWNITYVLEDGSCETVDIRKSGNVKLKWRIDWPMRWFVEQVDFEPGGKDHSTKGGSFDTGKQICKEVWGFDAPTYVMYDFINVKGAAGKMSSSAGNVITLGDVLEVYEPEVTRFLFASSRPNREFSISFDADVFAVYEEYDKSERAYFKLAEMNEKKREKLSVAYELSSIGNIPKKMPYQPSFRHLTMLVQINGFNIDKTIGYFEKELKTEFDKNRLRVRAQCAVNWIKRYAPSEFTFTVQEKCQVTLIQREKEILNLLAQKLEEKEWTDKGLHEEIYILAKNEEIDAKDLFSLVYKVLINKEKGPRLASFILEIGRKRVATLFNSV